MTRNLLAGVIAGAALLLYGCGGSDSGGSSPTASTPTPPASTSSISAQDAANTATPIKHIVILYQENNSFDHYFGTYPIAGNPTNPDELPFIAAKNTPAAENLIQPGTTIATSLLLTDNPNLQNMRNAKGATNPFRLDRSQALTADQSHGYTNEQEAFDGVVTTAPPVMDLFPLFTGKGETLADGTGPFATTGLVMGYYDGNTVTALWNYAQNFSMSDAFHGTTFGSSTQGAINLVSGQTNGVVPTAPTGAAMDDGTGTGTDTLMSDIFPTGDVCSPAGTTAMMTSKNIGDLLNAGGITWGWFQGGFDLTQTNPNGTTGCLRSTFSEIVGGYIPDNDPEHAPFQYYKSTANPQHTRPSSLMAIGTNNDGGANHQYDTDDFFAAVQAGNWPSVSFLKAPSWQSGHSATSDPLSEQAYLVNTVNFLEQQPDWKNTLVIITYDDSDGWYDHVPAVVNPSMSSADQLSGAGVCSTTVSPGTTTPLPGVSGLPANGRCGYGPRLPLIVISPFAKPNFIDHTLTDQTSLIRFIEDNWLNGQRLGQGSYDSIAGPLTNMLDFTLNTPTLVLDPNSGAAPGLQAKLQGE
ncbi:phospholipase C [Paraburkholderia solisilvae]|uniref:Non-hemolytic phospholipase C n=1 Tax=Paraburkholderia solisilvae TaxID=624376 RepID=A0A6J5E6C4_9BURK|nr:alkaline phosphatase family protein [Paraburkholderia solisilvae]CAB3762059.1 Non-hemolytic phospholipase C [Paraburkholderia solisilvae]